MALCSSDCAVPRAISAAASSTAACASSVVVSLNLATAPSSAMPVSNERTQPCFIQSQPSRRLVLMLFVCSVCQDKRFTALRDSGDQAHFTVLAERYMNSEKRAARFLAKILPHRAVLDRKSVV